MTATGPLPAIRETPAETRQDLLGQMSGFRDGIRFHYPTADVLVDTDRGVMFIACDPDPDPADWEAVCELIVRVGFDNGTWPNAQDPGEPVFDPLANVCVWRLEYV